MGQAAHLIWLPPVCFVSPPGPEPGMFHKLGKCIKYYTTEPAYSILSIYVEGEKKASFSSGGRSHCRLDDTCYPVISDVLVG